ncbi:MAG: hypothetical protein LH654_14540 [Thermoleophilia bacterium]|nr:hypothetical protein [Thermoleophilia bacterium]
MAFKRRTEPTTIEEEREALRAQHAALEDLKRQLAERIGAVREREVELHHALADVDPSAPRRAAPILAASVARHPGADTGENAEEAARRETHLADRERAFAEREAALAARAGELEAERARAAEVVAAAPAADPGEARLAQIESRLAELRDAEKLFLRTRNELAARSEAVAARERLVSQRERELDEREDAEVDRSATPGFTEMEARLRRLEQQQQDPREQTLGFSGGLRKLEQGTRQQRPS